MTKDEINQTIAKELKLPLRVERWRFCYDGIESRGYFTKEGAAAEAQRVGAPCGEPSPYWEDNTGLPDFYEDLNACYGMEELLTEEEWKEYCIPLGGRDINWTGAKKMLHASPSNKCKSFLRVRRLWKGDV